MEKRKAALHNLGCKVNSYETEAMQQLLEEAGYEIVPFAPGADVYVINTCTVTNIADRKSRQMLHRAKKMNPEAIVVAAGCYVQASREEAEQDAAIDLIIGNNQKKDLPYILEKFREHQGKMTWVEDLSHEHDYEELHISRTAEHTRAYIKVQDGCNQFCSYCIIPFTRGRVRSRKVTEVQREVQKLAGGGFQEIVLTGIHLSSYGKDLGSSLIELIEALHDTEGIQRIRLGSLEPGIITDEFVRRLKTLPKVCPHFHLSLQSGCNATLKRMNRRYTIEEYMEKCRMLREAYPHPALTTDIIVGFPMETEEEFETTRKSLEQISFYETHVFKYSRRKGTRAAVMEGQVDERVKTRRSEILLALDRENRKKYEAALLGSIQEVLFEETITLGNKPYFVGHTKEYVRIAVPWEEGLSNKILQVKVEEERTGEVLKAELLEK
mgnify:FL=1